MDNYLHTFQTWDKLASEYQDKFMDLNVYNDSYDIFCNLVEKQKAKILEIGCGPGNITKYLLSKRSDFEMVAIDTSPNMIALAEQNNPGVQYKLMDARVINTLDSKFDAIICGFCMPYLSKEDCITLIKDCSVLLNSGGIFYFSTIEDDYEKSDFESSSNGKHRMFVYYHQEDYLRQSVEDNHFEILQVIRKIYPLDEDTSSTHMIIIAKKQV